MGRVSLCASLDAPVCFVEYAPVPVLSTCLSLNGIQDLGYPMSLYVQGESVEWVDIGTDGGMDHAFYRNRCQ